MKKRTVRSRVRAVAQGSAFLLLLFSANPTPGQSAEKTPPPSVKGLKLKVSANGRYFVNQHPERVFDAQNAHAFGRFLAQRYKDNAVLWYVGGDSAPGKDEAVWVAMARGLKEGSGGGHLVCYHGPGHSSSSQWFHQAPWL